jgi:hypothetical protein
MHFMSYWYIYRYLLQYDKFCFRDICKKDSHTLMLTSLIFEHYINKEMEGGLQHE